jgi:hypothetical protein
VLTEQAGEARVTCAVTDPSGHAVEADVVAGHDVSQPTEIRFVPKTTGQYQINIFYGDVEVSGELRASASKISCHV